MTAKLIGELGADVGVTPPEVGATGADPVLPSAFPLGVMAAASAGALTAAVAAYARMRGRAGGGAGGPGSSRGVHRDPDVTIDIRRAAVAFQSERDFRIDGKAVDARAASSGVRQPRVDDLQDTMDSPFGTLTYVTPPGAVDGARPRRTTPPPPGEHPATWAPS